MRIAPGACFEDATRRAYRVERVLVRAPHGAATLCMAAGRQVIAELWRADGAGADLAAEQRASVLRTAVHPRVPALREMFLTSDRSRRAVAAFVFDVPAGIPVRAFLHRLAALAAQPKLFVILEIARQLAELSVAVELARLELSSENAVELDRVLVDPQGVSVTTFSTRVSSMASRAHPGALSVCAIARSALSLAAEFAPRSPTRRELREAFAYLDAIASLSVPSPGAADFLSWIHARVPRYERLRFTDLVTQRACSVHEETPATVLGPRGAAPRRSRAPLAPRPRPPPRPSAPPVVAGRIAWPSAFSLFAALAVLSFVVALTAAARRREDPREVGLGHPRIATTLLVRRSYDGSPSKKDASTAACTSCINLSAAPAGRRVFIDGLVRGETPLIVPVACGKHHLRVGSRSPSTWIDVPCLTGD